MKNIIISEEQKYRLFEDSGVAIPETLTSAAEDLNLMGKKLIGFINEFPTVTNQIIKIAKSKFGLILLSQDYDDFNLVDYIEGEDYAIKLYFGFTNDFDNLPEDEKFEIMDKIEDVCDHSLYSVLPKPTYGYIETRAGAEYIEVTYGLYFNNKREFTWGNKLN